MSYTQEVARPMVDPVTDDRDPTTNEELVALSELRWRRHEARIQADPLLHPKLKAMFLDRTLCNTAATAKRLGVSTQRVSLLRTSRRAPHRRRPHPARLMRPDDIDGYTAGVPDYSIFQGLLDHFRWQTRRGLWSLRAETLVAITPNLHGRPPGAKNKPKDEDKGKLGRIANAAQERRTTKDDE